MGPVSQVIHSAMSVLSANLSCPIPPQLLDQCLAPDTSGDGTGCDNMTCIIISFKPRNTHPPAESGKRKLEDMAAPAAPAEENGGDNNKKAKLE